MVWHWYFQKYLTSGTLKQALKQPYHLQKAERGQLASDLFRLGAIDREALLQSLDFPERHKILQRLAAEATGKSAGDPNVEGDPVADMLGMLQQMGLPPEMLEQIAQAMQQQGGGQPQQGGNFPPQMVM